MGPVQQSATASSSALFRALHPLSQTVTQDIPPPGFVPHATPSRQSVAERMAALSFPQPQRAVSTTEIPQTPRTQLIRSQLEQQNFEIMNTLQLKNQQQIKDLSAQLQTGLQAFLQQSMEQMFNRLAPAQTQPQAAASSSLPPHIVSITPVSSQPPAEAEEPMSKCLLPPPLHSHPLCRRLPLLQDSPLFFKPWNKRNTGLMLQPPPLPRQNWKTPQKLENRRHPLTSLSGRPISSSDCPG